MIFKKSYTVPANTSLQSPDHQKLTIAKGEIIGWIVFMPEEAADMLQLNVEYHNLQIFPFSGSEWWYGVYQAFLIPDNFPVLDSPYCLDIFAINLDDSYNHEYFVSVVIEPAEPEKIPAEGEAGLWDRLRNALGG
jgi:hypothetical protein